MTIYCIPQALKRHMLVATALLLSCLATSAWSDRLEDAQKRKIISIGISLDTPPFGMKNEKLEATGSDVATARLIAKEMGLELEIVPLTGPNRIPFLQTDRVDIVVSTMSITPEREKVIDFSLPYSGVVSVIGASKGLQIRNAADLSGKRIATVRGSTNDIELSKIAPKDAQIIRFDDDATCVTAVLSGQADAYATAPALLNEVNKKNPNMKYEVKFIFKTYFLAVGIKKGEPALKAKVDAIVKANLKNGRLNAINREFHNMDLSPDVMKFAE